MMAVTTKLYGNFAKSLALGKIDLEGHTFKGMLCGVGYSPNQDTHEFKSAVSNEVSGSGYAPGGQVINGMNVTYTGSTNLLVCTASTLLWPVVTFAARYLVVYDDEYPTPATKPLVLYVDFGETKSPANQSFYYSWPDGELLKIAVAA